MAESLEQPGSPKPGIVAHIRSFVIRHETLFAIFGALIVFIAFFTKEAILENVKEINAALEQAIFTHQMHDQFAVLQRQFDQVSGLHNPANGAEVWKDDAKLTSTAHDAVAAMTDAENMINDADELLNHLPALPPDLNARRTQIKTQLAAVKDNYDELAQAQGDLLDSTMYESLKDQYQNDLENIREVTLRFESKVLPLHEAAIELDHKVLLEAQRQKDNEELRYHRATKWMYIIFAFGWILGLFGKVWKLQPLGGSSEE
jgi:hypothetical protein